MLTDPGRLSRYMACIDKRLDVRIGKTGFFENLAGMLAGAGQILVDTKALTTHLQGQGRQACGFPTTVTI